jgi:hypothetical protein
MTHEERQEDIDIEVDLIHIIPTVLFYGVSVSMLECIGYW